MALLGRSLPVMSTTSYWSNPMQMAGQVETNGWASPCNYPVNHEAAPVQVGKKYTGLIEDRDLFGLAAEPAEKGSD